MTRPQNSPRGLFAKEAIKINAQTLTGNSTAVTFSGGVKLGSQTLTGNSTAVTFSGPLTLGSQTLSGNSTAATFSGPLTLGGALTLGGVITGSGDGAAVLVTATAALPGDVSAEGFSFLSNSTGNALLVNTTGTTWKYLSVTSVQPT